jgi:PAS domain S-box-containing protein
MMLALAETASDAIVTVDGSGRIAYGNPALTRMFGYEPGALLGRPSEILFCEPDRPEQRERREQLLTTHDPALIGRVGEATALRADGGEFPVEISQASWVAAGEPVLAGIIRDISARHRAEQKLRGLLQSAPDAIFVVNRDGEILVANARAENVFGYTRAELVGQPIELLVPGSGEERNRNWR